ncbi:MAG TPA: hypothetical protein VFI92_07845 [Steroidobacteraceae bacterium]|nr:hypothetical protein [Steroidobacteraceae bacterium]
MKDGLARMPASREAASAQFAAREIAPRPKTVADTGLSQSFLGELIEKHLFDGGVLTIAALARRTALTGAIIEDLLAFLRKEGRIEVRAKPADEQGLRYGLTDRGRDSAADALMRGGYVGPAPVPLARYLEVAAAQSVRDRRVNHAHMRDAFADVVLDPALLDRLGPSMNSGKAIFVYGPAGTGKTYVTQRLARLFDDSALVPHAIAVGETVIQVFDPTLHKPIEHPEPAVLLDDGYDPRFARCRRPVVVTGGELGPDMLEVQYDAATRQYRAPLQLKATNGMFILDDLGRQRVAPEVVLNRWIVPMEEGRDYLSLGTGQHFSVLFDVILIFSTNLDPLKLADEAFLRRIGYKLRFDPLTPVQYHAIWSQVCAGRGVPCDPDLCQFVIDALHGLRGVPLLPCHPRDLIGIALDRADYLGAADRLTRDSLQWAWENYFVRLDAPSSESN